MGFTLKLNSVSPLIKVPCAKIGCSCSHGSWYDSQRTCHYPIISIWKKRGDNPILQFSSSAKNILLMSVFIKPVFQGHTMSLRKLRELGLIYQSHHIKTWYLCFKLCTGTVKLSYLKSTFLVEN